MGKPFLQAYAENMWAAGILRYYAGLADKIGGKTIPIGLFVCLFVTRMGLNWSLDGLIACLLDVLQMEIFSASLAMSLSVFVDR